MFVSLQFQIQYKQMFITHDKTSRKETYLSSSSLKVQIIPYAFKQLRNNSFVGVRLVFIYLFLLLLSCPFPAFYFRLLLHFDLACSKRECVICAEMAVDVAFAS